MALFFSADLLHVPRVHESLAVQMVQHCDAQHVYSQQTVYTLSWIQ